jgi:concanavalin A-like lectin/glucanase superfamily protein
MRGLHSTAAMQGWLGALAVAGLLASGGCAPDDMQAPGSGEARPRAPKIDAAVAPTSGLVGEWKLDETSGTTAVDSKNGYNATVFGGAAWVAGKLGNSLNFNNGTAGTGGKYAELPSNTTLDNVQEGNYTISAWFYPYSVPPFTVPENKYWAIVNKQGLHMGLIYESGGTFAARHWLLGDTLEAVRSTARPVNAWYHVVSAVNKTAGTLKLYVNGVLQGTATFAPNHAARDYGTYPFRLGRGRIEWSADGKVDQVRIYNRELSSSEVGDLYNETTGAIGVPFGPDGAWSLSQPTEPAPNTSVFSMGATAEQPNNIVNRLEHAAEIGKKALLMITGGGHNNYKTPADATGHFDYAKWKARVNLFNTSAIKTAVTDAFNNGTLVGFNMLDEPQAADWNNNDVPIRITKRTLDSMATYMKSVFGSQIPMGVSVRSDWHLSDPKYQVLDFIVTQYVEDFGSVTAWRDNAFTNVAADKVKILFSLNVLNGGAGFNETPATCNANAATGGPSPVSSSRCSMGRGQIETFGSQVMQAGPGGKKGVGLTMWTYESAYFARPEMQSAFSTLAGILNPAPRQSWLRYP